MDNIPDMAGRVSFIIVHYNDAAHLPGCLETLLRHCEGGNDEIILIDSASSDPTWKEAIEPFRSRISLHELDENRGFGAGCNYGANLARGHYLFFLNPDLEFPEDPLPRMLEFMRQHPETGTLGPKLVFADGSLQPSRGTFPHLLLTATQIFKLKRFFPRDEVMISCLSRFLGGRFTRGRFAQWEAIRGVQAVDYTLGAALLIRKDIFQLAGGFDERYFLYFEEIDLCKRLVEHGYTNYYVPEVSLVHHMSASGEPYFGLKNVAYVESLLSFYHKHHSSLRFYLVYFLLGLHTCGSQFLLRYRRNRGLIEADDYSRHQQKLVLIRKVMRKSHKQVKCRISSRKHEPKG